MSQTEKAGYYRSLKEAGVPFDKHYREYSTDELKTAYEALVAERPELAIEAEPEGDPEAAAAFFGTSTQLPPPRSAQAAAPVAQRDPNEMAGQRLNSQAEDEPIRVDENGLVWYQEEVRKPAFAKPRGRRVLKYMETGVKEVTTKNGEYVETFEVAGDGPKIPSEVKVTLPSYQVGIYKDKRFPFKIHVYNEIRGFDLFEVQNYYGGSELVPQEIKRMYVENVLCYDIRTTVRAIQTEFRQLQLAGKVQ